MSNKKQKPLTNLGDRYENTVGQWATVVEYLNSSNVTIEFDGYPEHRQVYPAGTLRRGQFKNKKDPMNMLGKRFMNNSGEWVTVKEYRSAVEVMVEFEDGVISKTATSYLKSGSFLHPHKFTSVVGKRFKNNQGDWCTVLKYENTHKVHIKFDGYGDYVKIVSHKALKEGSFRNNYKPTVFGLGYLGEGKYQGSEKDGTVTVYTVWYNMMARCYDPYTQKLQPAYIGCSVDPYFHSFQNFADFYVNHESYGLGYNLDKDLLGGDNKVYSPETCTMLPPEINSMITGSTASKNGMPLGVNKIDNGYVARLNKGKEGREYLGYYKTPEEAHKVYVEAKERYVKNKALEYANRIEWKAFVALVNWTVYPKEEDQNETC